MSDNRPIGVFDSGLGGLTVYKALKQALPQEDFIYLGDTARTPYGTKSPETITQYALQAAHMLLEEDIKLLVVACNTASAHALPSLQKMLPDMPCLGVVEAGASAAVKASVTGKIVVMATEGTVRSGTYPAAIKRHYPTAEVQGLACNLLVGLVEEGWWEGAEVDAVVSRFLRQLDDATFDALVLGCTHFPVLVNAIRALLPPEVKIVDSAATTAQAVREYLQAQGVLKTGGKGGQDRFLVTDAPERFRLFAQRFLQGMDVPEVKFVRLF